MQHREMPAIASSAYTSATTNLSDWSNHKQAWLNQIAAVGTTPTVVGPVPAPAKKETAMIVNRRLVQVFIADPNEHVPLEQSLLYRGEQKLTDLTDQELFFEVDIKSLLDKHNETRVKFINKSVKERAEYLEPARIRDLKMVVVSVAAF